MPRESNLELKVGFFVLLGFLALTVFIFSISDFSAFEKGRTIRVIFGFANGVKKSAPVRFAGVDAGLIKDIDVFYDQKEKNTKVAITAWLKEGTEIPQDSQVSINQLGLLGEKYIEIMPGADTEHFLEEGATLVGEDPIPVEKLSTMIADLAEKIQKSVDGFNAVVHNEKNQKSLQDTLEGISLIVDNIKRGNGTVGKLLYDQRIFDDLQDLTSDLKANPWKLLYRPKTTGKPQ